MSLDNETTYQAPETEAQETTTISAKGLADYQSTIPETYRGLRMLLGQVQNSVRRKGTAVVQTIRRNNWANFLNYLPDVKTFAYMERLVVEKPAPSREQELVTLLTNQAGAMAVLEVVEFWRLMYTRSLESYQQALEYLVVPAQIELFALIELHCKPAPFDHFQGCRRNFFCGGSAEDFVGVSTLTQMVLKERLALTTDEDLWKTVRYWHTHGMLANIAHYLTLAGHCPSIAATTVTTTTTN